MNIVNLPVERLSILCAVFATFGEDLDAILPLAQIDVNLTEFPINLVLHAHSSMAHVKTVLDAAPFHPGLSSNFDT